MSYWGPNATWLRQGAWFLREKGTKTGRHVALAGRDVVLGFQRDVVEAASLFFGQKRDQKWAPRRIGGGRCRVGVPTRRGRGGEPGFCAKKVQKQGATSYWRGAMSCWGSNATWQAPGTRSSGKKEGKRRSDVVAGTRPICHVKR